MKIYRPPPPEPVKPEKKEEALPSEAKIEVAPEKTNSSVPVTNVPSPEVKRFSA